MLFSCIENLLGFLKVRNLVLPAADEAESLWTNKFGFKKIPEDEVCTISEINFPGHEFISYMVFFPAADEIQERLSNDGFPRDVNAS